MRIRSLRALIVGSLVVTHIGLTTAFLLAAGDFAIDRQRDYARAAMATTVASVSSQTTEFLNRLSRITRLTRGLAEAGIVRTEQLPSLEAYFFEVLRAHPEITGVYFGTPGGDFVFVTRDAPGLGRNARFFSRSMVGSEGGRRSTVRLRDDNFALVSEHVLGLTEPFEPRRRPWFQPATRAEGVVWTQPYNFFTAGTPGVSAAIRVEAPDGDLLGVVGADVSLAALRAFVDRLRVGETGYVFLLDPRGRAISHPRLTRLGSPAPPLTPIDALGDALLAQIADEFSADAGVFEEPLSVEDPEGRRFFVMAQPLTMEQGAWTIGAVVPYSDLFGWFGKLSRIVVLLSLGLTLLWGFAGLLLWRAINRRHARLRALAGQVQDLVPESATSAPGGFTELERTERAIELALETLARQQHENHRLLEEARRSDRAKTLFLASMSHELRTPLNAIGGFAEIIEREMLGPIGVGRYREYAGLIGRSNRRMLELVENLLDASALEFGTMQLHLETVELDRLVLEIAEEQRLEATRRNLRLEATAKSGLTALVDAPKLRILLSNLLRNAVAYTPAGGAVAVELAANAEGAPVFQVSDTGIGIDPARLEQLRQPFARGLENSYVAGETGTGLGLSIVDRIAALHEARLNFETAPDAGTRVTVTLPRACVVEPAATDSSEEPPPASR